MNETIGIALLSHLKNDSYIFYSEGKSYELLQEYLKGFPMETLQILLAFEDKWIKRVSIWIVLELGINGETWVSPQAGLIC